jgi:hypothetical protein
MAGNGRYVSEMVAEDENERKQTKAPLLNQKDSALAQWYRQRTANAPSTRKPLIVALARQLLIALWRFAQHGVVPEGVAKTDW